MKFRAFTLLVLTLACVGCATYQPPEGGDDEYAVVMPPKPKMGEMASIYQVDGKLAKAFLMPESYFDGVRVAPGKHTLRIKVLIWAAVGWTDLWLVAEKGKSYRIALSRNPEQRRFRAWLEEDGSGKAIGGLVGSSDEPQAGNPAAEPEPAR